MDDDWGYPFQETTIWLASTVTIYSDVGKPLNLELEGKVNPRIIHPQNHMGLNPSAKFIVGFPTFWAMESIRWNIHFSKPRSPGLHHLSKPLQLYGWTTSTQPKEGLDTTKRRGLPPQFGHGELYHQNKC